MLTRHDIVTALERLKQLDVDIADASRLLGAMGPARDRAEVWQRLLPYLVPGRELKAQYAFEDLWESIYGNA